MKTIYNKLLLLLLLLPFGALAQGTVTGKVLEKSSGQPLPGVNVVVQGTTNGTSTDFDGNFRLANVKSGDKIVFSYVGYGDVIFDYTGQQSISISLAEDANQLNEVIIQVGYGTVTRTRATTAVTTVTTEDFTKGPLVSADQLLQGRVAGLQITNGGGAPGEGSTIRIRSGSSLTANNDPLYVIDGVPVDVGGGGVQGGRNPLANINQNDIESMTVLKDAAATAIYGSRASNGVVIVTTKKGRSGEMQVTYNGNFQVSEVTNSVDVMSGDEYREFINTNGSAAQIALLGTENTDWQDKIFRTAFGTDHNVSLAGGANNLTYRTSVGYTNMNGVLRHDNFERSTISGNLIADILDKHLKIELNNRSSIISNNFSERGAVGAAVAFDPTQPVYAENEAGNFFQWYSPAGTYEVNASRNPVSLLEQKHNFGTTFRSLGNVQAEYKIHSFEDLKLVANIGYDYATGRAYGYTDDNYIVPGEAGSEYNRTETNKNRLMDLYFNYNNTFESINTNVDFTGGYNYQDFRYEYRADTYNATNDILELGNLSKTRVNLQSFFGRATFSIADKYVFQGSLRADASSRFTEENRWGYFPSASFAWNITNEEFAKGGKVVNNLKFRASWGITGQQELGALNRYPSVPLYNGSTGTAGYHIGYDAEGNPIFISTMTPLAYNEDLKWEETETINLGLDFGFFNNRLTGSVDVYKKKTSDLLLFAQNPQGVNFSNFANYNIGNLESEGVEFGVEGYPIKTDKFSLRLAGNITFQHSEITVLTNSAVPGFAGYNTGGILGGTGTTIQNHQVGFAPFSFLVFEQAYDSAGLPIDGVFVDRNGDGIINGDDRYRYKKPAPDYFYGFSTDINYGKWDMSMNWRGSVGNYNYNNVFSNFGNQSVGLPSNGNYLNNVHVNVNATNITTPQYESDYYIQDASFLKLDNVTLGYTFENVFNDGATLRLTGMVQNVFVITGYNGIDPEFANGIDNNLYPRPRTYSLGMNINF